MLQYKYNPQNAPFDELKKTFTARKELLSMLLDEIKNLRTSKSNQHYLIIGPRGIGKTNLLQMIYLNIKEDDILSNSFIPLQFAEEEYSIGNLREVFGKMIEVLIEETFSSDAEKFLEQLQSEDNDKIAADRAIEFLKNKSKIEKKKFIVFVDNLDLILDEQFKDKMETKKLRDILMNEEFMILIGAAPTYFDEVSKYDKPLYNFFKIINLNELDEMEVEKLIKKRAEFDENFELIEKLELYRPRIKALKHLTGGNPRLILMIYQILALSEFSEVKNYLNELLDDLTPYYQYKLKMLAPQQRKIVEAMAKLNKAVSPTEISKATRLAVNKVSSNIKRLVDDGYVKIGQQERRKSTLYIISERLFRIWYQMRHSRSMRRKIEMFVEFIQIWYSAEELVKESKRLSDKFYKHLSAKETAKAKNIIEHLDYIAAANYAPEKKYEIEDDIIQKMFEINDLDNAEKKLLDRKRECQKTSNSEELAHCLYGLGILNVNKGKLKEALESYDEAIKIKPDYNDAWCNRGNVLVKLDKYEEAIKNYDEAIKIKPDYQDAWYNRGMALSELGKYEEAIKSYDEVIKIKPDNQDTWYNKGIALAHQKQYEEALISFKEGIQFAKDDEEKKLFYFQIMQSYLAISSNEVLIENRGNAIKTFISGLDYLAKIDNKELTESIYKIFHQYFDIIISQKNAELVIELLSELLQKGFKKEYEFLEPYRIAANYWLKEKDRALVLDTLNPEVREIVEEIINKAEHI